MVRNRKLRVEGGLAEAAAGQHYNTSSFLVISAILSLCCCWGIHSKELRWKSVCEDELFLDCGNSSVIAIHEATFSSDVTQIENASCPIPEDYDTELNTSSGTCQEDIRVPINRRCSGLGNCNFSYSHHSGRRCNSRIGVVTVQYDCVRESAINKYCNVQIRSKEGYIATPAYPRFYIRLEKCEWKIQAGDGQTVILRFLDVHIWTPNQRNGLDYCDDAVTVLEGNTRRFSACGEEIQNLQTLEADVDKGLVVQFSSQEFHTASGFLLYFKVQGCSTLPPPVDGYLVHRNGSSATYVCCQKYLFNDTLESSRTLQCIGEHHWNDTLAPCVAVEELKQIYVNHTLDLDPENNLTMAEPKPNILAAKSSYMEDILVPSILMAALLLGNALIVAVILRIRRKQKSKLELEDDDLSPQRSIPEATNV